MSSVGQLNFIFLIVLKIPLLYIDATIIRSGLISFASSCDIIGIELVIYSIPHFSGSESMKKSIFSTSEKNMFPTFSKNYFFEVRKKIGTGKTFGHSFDAENCALSISGTSRPIPELLHRF